MVPPCSDRISRVPPYSRTSCASTRTGLSPAMARLSRRFRFYTQGHWPGPRSLATTSGVSVDVLSSGYLDVSVRRVRLPTLWIQVGITLRWGFPIRKSADQSLLAAPRSLSQRATSFIASQCQGIHEMPLRRLIASYAGASPTHDTLYLHDPRQRSSAKPPVGKPPTGTPSDNLCQIRKTYSQCQTTMDRPMDGRHETNVHDKCGHILE